MSDHRENSIVGAHDSGDFSTRKSYNNFPRLTSHIKTVHLGKYSSMLILKRFFVLRFCDDGETFHKTKDVVGDAMILSSYYADLNIQAA